MRGVRYACVYFPAPALIGKQAIIGVPASTCIQQVVR
eukprot:IDg12145t1